MKLKRNLAVLFAAASAVVLISLAFANGPDDGSTSEAAGESAGQTKTSDSDSGTATAIFAGGCFWCVESDFDHVPGVLETVSGYSGGETTKPNYKNHHSGRHREVVRITYDTATVNYAELVDVFWRSIDPTDDGGQFCDRGHSYTTAIYTTDDAQLSIAMASLEKLNEEASLKDPIVTAIEPASEFWPAEGYHQDYYLKNPIRYKYYRAACGRDKRVEKVWGTEAHSGIEKS